MADAENNLQPSRTRAAGRQLSRDNPGLDNEETSETDMGNLHKVIDEVMANSRIDKAHCSPESPSSDTTAALSNLFAEIRRLAPPTDFQATRTAEGGGSDVEKIGERNDTKEENKENDKLTDTDVSVAQSGPTSEKEETDKASNSEASVSVEKTAEGNKSADDEIGDGNSAADEKTSEGKKDEGNNSDGEARKDTEEVGNGSGSLFGTKSNQPSFSFGLSSNGKSAASVVGKSGGTAFPSKREVPIETGEENERAVFTAESMLSEFINGKWKKWGKGELRVNVSTTETGKARLVVRTKRHSRLILNASLCQEMKLTTMEKKGSTCAYINCASEGKDGLSTYSLNFKDASIVEKFRASVTEHKDKASTPQTPENSPKAPAVMKNLQGDSKGKQVGHSRTSKSGALAILAKGSTLLAKRTREEVRSSELVQEPQEIVPGHQGSTLKKCSYPKRTKLSDQDLASLPTSNNPASTTDVGAAVKGFGPRDEILISSPESIEKCPPYTTPSIMMQTLEIDQVEALSKESEIPEPPSSDKPSAPKHGQIVPLGHNSCIPNEHFPSLPTEVMVSLKGRLESRKATELGPNLFLTEVDRNVDKLMEMLLSMVSTSTALKAMCVGEDSRRQQETGKIFDELLDQHQSTTDSTNAEVSKLRDYLYQSQNRCKHLQETLKEKSSECSNLRAKVKKMEATIKEREARVAENERALQTLVGELEKCQGKVSAVQHELDQSCHREKDVTLKVIELNDTIKVLRIQMSEAEARYRQEKRQAWAEKRRALANRETELKEQLRQEFADDFQQRWTKREAELEEQLRRKIAEELKAKEMSLQEETIRSYIDSEEFKEHATDFCSDLYAGGWVSGRGDLLAILQRNHPNLNLTKHIEDWRTEKDRDMSELTAELTSQLSDLLTPDFPTTLGQVIPGSPK